MEIFFFAFLFALCAPTALILALVALAKAADLQERVRRLEEHMAAHASASDSFSVPIEQKTYFPHLNPEVGNRPGSASSSTPLSTIELLRGALPSKESSVPEPGKPASAPKTSFNLEQLIGVNLFQWIGSFSFLLAAVYLVNYGGDRGFLTPKIRMIADALMGLVVYGLSWRLDREKRTNIPNLLAFIGASSLFAVILGARYYYHWLSVESALALLTLSDALLLIRGWFKNEAFSYIGIALGYAAPLLAQSVPLDTKATCFYLTLLTITFCGLALQRKQAKYADMAILLQWIWSIGLIIAQSPAAAGYAFALPAFLVSAGAAWAVFEKIKTRNGDQEIYIFTALTIASFGVLFLFGAIKSFGTEFWFSLFALAVWIAIWNRVSAKTDIVFMTLCAVFTAGLFVSQFSDGICNLYAAGILFLAALLQIGSKNEDGKDLLRILSADLPAAGASLLLWRAKMEPAVARSFLIQPVFLAFFQALCLGYSWFRAADARGKDLRPNFEIASSVFFGVIALSIVTLAPQYWWAPGIGLSIFAVLAARRGLDDEGGVYFKQAFGLGVGAFSLGIYFAVRDLCSGPHGSEMLFYAPAVWLAFPILPLAFAHRQFLPKPAYASFKDNIVSLIQIFGLCAIFWQGHMILSSYLPPREPASATIHAGSLLCVMLAYVWLLNRLRGSDERSISSQIFIGFYFLGIVASFLIGAVADNPWASRLSVGSAKFFNALWLIYGIPWAIIALMSMRLPRAIPEEISSFIKKMCLFAEMILAVALVQQAFHGPYLWNQETTLLEQTLTSATMAAYGVALLGAGIARKSKTLRLTSLVILLLTAVKLFLSDLSSLSGLYRFASFFGLGIALMTIGYIYQKTDIGGEKQQ